jgi:hypothetical protein
MIDGFEHRIVHERLGRKKVAATVSQDRVESVACKWEVRHARGAKSWKESRSLTFAQVMRFSTPK